MSGLRRARLQQVADSVIRSARFRTPQRASFDKIVQMVEGLQDDLDQLSPDELRRGLREQGLQVAGQYADYQFALATGVGKRRLMGGIAAFLYGSRQTQNILILASRKTILDKLEQVIEPSDDDYLFLDAGIVPDPAVTTRATLETFRPHSDRLNVFILSPQSLATGVRIAHRGEFREQSVLEYLQSCNDLIVLTDEAHHIGKDEAAWRQAVASLEPRLHLGFTATPRDDAQVLVSYDLADCLQDGLYTKALSLLVRSQPEGISDDDWDRATLEYALRRLEVKQAALDQFREDHDDFPAVNAVLLVGAANIAQADAVADWLCDGYGLKSEEVAVAHSRRKQRDEEIEQLLAIDQPGNPVRVVVHVHQLSEGWDVTNIYVIAPLRALATYQVALQTVGRGLRLPAGDRVDNEDIDTLEVVLFGKRRASEILEEAKEDFSDPDLGGSLITVQASEDVDDEIVELIKQHVELAKSVSIDVPQVTRKPEPTSLDIAVSAQNRTLQDLVTKVGIASVVQVSSSTDDGVSYTVGSIIQTVRSRVCANRPYLSPPIDGPSIDKLTMDVLRQLGADPAAIEQLVFVDPNRVALLIGEEIDRHRRASVATYTVATSSRSHSIPSVELRVRKDQLNVVDPDSVEHN